MSPDLSPPHGHCARVLLVENNLSTYGPLIRTFGDTRFDIDYDVCDSYSGAARMLSVSRYQLIISDVHLAEMDDFFLLKRAQMLQPFVPFLVTAGASEKEAGRRALLKNAFDVITSPLNHEQTVQTIRLALWEGKLRSLTARKEHALQKYHQHMTFYPGDKGTEESFNRTLVAFEQTISSIRTMVRIESTGSFSPFAADLKSHRRRELERLDSLTKESAISPQSQPNISLGLTFAIHESRGVA